MSKMSERFFAKVDKTGPDGCWNWTAGLLSSGYGKFSVRNRAVGAHRVSWELANGPIPKGMWVLHRCDNRMCVNPDHLFLGTSSDNIRDMDAKGRRVILTGEAHHRSKLKAEQVREIRSSQEPITNLANRYGVNWITVYDAKIGKTWKDLP